MREHEKFVKQATSCPIHQFCDRTNLKIAPAEIISTFENGEKSQEKKGFVFL